MVKLANFTSCVFVHNKIKNSKAWMFKLNHTSATFIRLACPSLLGLSAWCPERLGASCGSPLRSRPVHGQRSGLPTHPSQHRIHVLLLAHMKKQKPLSSRQDTPQRTLCCQERYITDGMLWEQMSPNFLQLIFSKAHAQNNPLGYQDIAIGASSEFKQDAGKLNASHWMVRLSSSTLNSIPCQIQRRF